MLCPNHKGKVFSPTRGRCANCGNATTNSQFKLCASCSGTLKQCQICRCAVVGGACFSPQPAPQNPQGDDDNS
jgi:hypothetical protein